MIRALIWTMSLAALSPACTDGGSPADSGLDADDGLDGDDSAQGDDSADSDLGDVAFQVHVPAGASLCSGFAEGRTYQEELALLSTIALVPGTWSLERREGEQIVANPIGAVVLGPDREEIPGAGGAIAVQSEFATNGLAGPSWSFTFRAQTRRSSGEEVAVSLRVRFDSQDGSWPAAVDLTALPPPASVRAELVIGDGADQNTQRQRYALCGLPDPPVRQVEATAVSGARVRFEVRIGPWYTVCFAIGETACYFLTRAEVHRGAYDAVIEDRMRLVYNGTHHNWYDKYLLLLDPPDGDAHAILVISPDFITQDGAELVFLGAALEELSRERIQNWAE